MYFEFNGQNCAHMGMLLLDRPSIPTPARRGESVLVPGRSGEVWLDDGADEAVATSLRFWLMPSGSETAVRAWLRGSGKMRLNHDPYYYRMRVDGAVSVTPLMEEGYLLQVPCLLSPYRVNEDALPFTVDTSGTYAGHGDLPAYPMITVYGAGACEININGVAFGFDALPGSGTVIDCERMECHYNGQEVSAAMQGEYPTLSPRGNTITLLAGCSALSIAPRWRAFVSGRVDP